MRLSILMTHHHRLLSLAAIIDTFETANRFLAEEGQEPMFELQMVGGDTQPSLPEHLHQISYINYQDDHPRSDVVIVPAFRTENMSETVAMNAHFIPWLINQYQAGASVASLCTGSFLLAAAGLLNNREATTHIEAAPAFAHAFPQVKLQPHAIITQSENIYTSGGATSSFHLKLLLIQRYCGRAIAIRIAKNFAIDMDRSNQLYFEYFKPGALSEDQIVRSVQSTIHENFSEIRNVEEAMSAVPSSRRNIIRRFKQATGMTPIRYLQKTKIEAAKHLLETTNKDILDVMVSSGYSDLKNFRNLFKTFTGLTPKDYRDKYGMRMSI